MTDDLVDKIKWSNFEGNAAKNSMRYIGDELRDVFPSENAIAHSYEREKVIEELAEETPKTKTGLSKALNFLSKKKDAPKFKSISTYKFSYNGNATNQDKPHFEFYQWRNTGNGGWREDSDVLGIENIVTAREMETGFIAQLQTEVWHYSQPREFHYSWSQKIAEAKAVQKEYAANGKKISFGDAYRDAGRSLHDRHLAEWRKINPLAGCSGRIMVDVMTDSHKLEEGVSKETLADSLAQELCREVYERTSAHINPEKVKYQVGEALKLFDPQYRAAQIAATASSQNPVKQD
jgi:hypothetical protein